MDANGYPTTQTDPSDALRASKWPVARNAQLLRELAKLLHTSKHFAPTADLLAMLHDYTHEEVFGALDSGWVQGLWSLTLGKGWIMHIGAKRAFARAAAAASRKGG